MGMIAIYLRVSGKELENYIEKSNYLLERIHFPKDDNRIDIDKAFAGLFYLLTGQDYEDSEKSINPLSWILVAPQDIDPNQDLGYGPASYVTVQQTKEVSLALNSIFDEELKSRFDPNYFNEMCIYPLDNCEWDNESFEYLHWAFKKLKDFYRIASLNDHAIIQFFG